MGDAVQQPNIRMSVDEFLDWAEGREERHELIDGHPHAMSPERIGHAEAKFAAQTALKDAIGRAGLPCHMLPDGITVRIDAHTAYEPDALVYCGPRLPRGDTMVPAPVVVVEVLSPGTRETDTGLKLAGYFAVPGLRHYLIVDIDRRTVIHHRRDGDDIATRILGSGPLRLDPPGLDLDVAELFDEA